MKDLIDRYPSVVKVTFEDDTKIAAGFNLEEKTAEEVVDQFCDMLQRRKNLVNSKLGAYIKKKSSVISHRLLRFSFIYKGREIETELSGVVLSNRVLTDKIALSEALNLVFGSYTDQLDRLTLLPVKQVEEEIHGVPVTLAAE